MLYEVITGGVAARLFSYGPGSGVDRFPARDRDFTDSARLADLVAPTELGGWV